MILKDTDAKSVHLVELASLLSSPGVPPDKQALIERELKFTGTRGKEAGAGFRMSSRSDLIFYSRQPINVKSKKSDTHLFQAAFGAQDEHHSLLADIEKIYINWIIQFNKIHDGMNSIFNSEAFSPKS